MCIPCNTIFASRSALDKHLLACVDTNKNASVRSNFSEEDPNLTKNKKVKKSTKPSKPSQEKSERGQKINVSGN